jgi:homoserine dehydrogenase
LLTRDEPGVIGHIGTCFGQAGVSIQSIVQYEGFDTDLPRDADTARAEIVVITHEVRESRFREALTAIRSLREVDAIAACLRTL